MKEIKYLATIDVFNIFFVDSDVTLDNKIISTTTQRVGRGIQQE